MGGSAERKKEGSSQPAELALTLVLALARRRLDSLVSLSHPSVSFLLIEQGMRTLGRCGFESGGSVCSLESLEVPKDWRCGMG